MEKLLTGILPKIGRSRIRYFTNILQIDNISSWMLRSEGASLVREGNDRLPRKLWKCLETSSSDRNKLCTPLHSATGQDREGLSDEIGPARGRPAMENSASLRPALSRCSL